MKINEIHRKDLLEKSGIYKLSAGGHIYIGSSKNLYDRLREHRSDLRNQIHSNNFLQKVYNKYTDEFDVEIIEFCEPEIRRDREKYWIKELNADMNLSDPVTLTPLTEDALHNLQTSMANATTKRIHKLYNMTAVECYDYFGDYICTYNNMDEAAEDLGVDRIQIQKAARGYKKGVVVRGKRFRYINSKVPIQKFDINPQFLGRYFDFNYIDDNGEEKFAFDSVKNVYAFFAEQARQKKEKIVIIPRLRKYCEAWNAPKSGNHIPSSSESEEKDQRLEEVAVPSGVDGETSTSAVQ